MTERSNGLGDRRTKVRMPAKRMSATVPEAIGERRLAQRWREQVDGMWRRRCRILLRDRHGDRPFLLLLVVSAATASPTP